MIKADWLLAPALARGEVDIFGMPITIYEAEGNSADHVAWLHRTVRTYAERLEPTSTLLDSVWVCRAEDCDNAVRELITTIAAARGARMTPFASQWLGKALLGSRPSLRTVAGIIEELPTKTKTLPCVELGFA